MYLLLSIVFNAYLGVIFGYFHRYKIDTFQAIVFNYLTCVLTGSIVLGGFPLNTTSTTLPWFPWALLMGVLFISVFNLVAFSSKKVGITITQTSNRLSMMIPVLVSVLAYGEGMSWLKGLGMLLAIVAVLLSSQGPRTSNTEPRGFRWEYLLPLLLFLGSGVIDTLTKFVERSYIRDTETANAYLIAGFGVAGSCGLVLLVTQYLRGRRRFKANNLLAGILLGVPNYFSIYFLIKALQSPSLSSSAIIPINNIGVLLVVGLFGLFVFREKLSKANLWGLFLTVLSILCIFFGDKL